MAEPKIGLQTDHFLGQPILTPCDDFITWKLLADFKYFMNDKNGSEMITVTQGFTTDFASVPRLFWNIFPPWGKYGNAAILHDCLYTRQDRPRKVCDEIFLDAMWCLGVNYFVRWLLYWAVRLGGKSAWDKHAAENLAKGIV